MAILANLFSSLPTSPPPLNAPYATTPPPPLQPPIPIPKYPPRRKNRKSQTHTKTFKNPQNDSNTPAFNTHHRNSKYYKPIKPGQVLSPETKPAVDGVERSIVVGETGVSYRLPGAPFEFSFSYSEIPKAKPLALREPAFLPFAPPSMPRPWTGKAPMKRKKTRKIKLFGGGSDDEEEDGDGETNVKYYEMLKAYELGKYDMRPREEVLGEPLTKMEIKELLKPLLSTNKQVNLGRDGLTHNMLELIHSHWRRQPVCKVRCLGVPTVDMDNICHCLEDKTDGKIIHRVGGIVFIFRGRNYDHRSRPKLPVMLWKPAAPVYPKLIKEAPEGLTKEEADELRTKGTHLLPICKLAKNGVYVTLVRDVRVAFEGCPLVKIDCKGMQLSDYKKLGAKLKELVPCVLLSFDDEQILMWRGKDWKPRYVDVSPSISSRPKANILHSSGNQSANFHNSEVKRVSSSPRMMSLWKRAIESGKALPLDEIDLGPDDLLAKVEQFESMSQATEHSYPALILPHNNASGDSRARGKYAAEGDDDNEDETYTNDHNKKDYINYVFDAVESSPPLGSLPVDVITEELSDNEVGS